MSSFWTPDGERPISSETQATEPTSATDPAIDPGPPSEAEMAQQMAELQRQLAETPAAVVIANHCFGLFELAALHLSLPNPQLTEAKLAIDALGFISQGLTGRLGEGEEQLAEGLKQLKLAYVQIENAAEAAGEAGASAN